MPFTIYAIFWFRGWLTFGLMQIHVCVHTMYVVLIGVRAMGSAAPSPQSQAKPLFFWEKPAAKNETCFLYLLNEKTEFILSSKMNCPKSWIFTNNYWVG